ncbi:hypothetical protein SAMN04487950_2840 [Halogranum rubrum]|uniref:Uncharacterized protein n=1 Tax=Halogranum rubrum TaxID=553466 RepID=A0A1I4FIU6_9EURY|nr:hypothetical protein [Halogranum rubrum]SFL16746.1 hypothetical protein SAMN04487950_2840 [Halogranum rubrum]
MRLTSFLTERNILGMLLVGVVVLGAGFGYVLPALSGADDGSELPTKQSDQTGLADAASANGAGETDIASNSQTTREGELSPSQSTASSRPTSAPDSAVDGDVSGGAETGQDHASNAGNPGHSDSADSSGPDENEDASTSGVAVTGQTNAAAN